MKSPKIILLISLSLIAFFNPANDLFCANSPNAIITFYDSNSSLYEDPFIDNTINNIYLEKQLIYDTNSYCPLFNFAFKILNTLHINTKTYVIKNEILFNQNDKIDELLLEETERNLRRLGIFSYVRVELDSSNNVNITTRDSWSLKPSVIVELGGEEKAIGGSINETNLFGTNTNIRFDAVYRSRNDAKWGTGFSILNNRIFQFGLGANYGIFSDKFRFNQYAGIYKNFLNLEDKYAGGVYANYDKGEKYIYSHLTDFDTEKNLRYYEDQNIYAYFSRAWKNIDRIFFSTSIDLNKSKRDEHKIAYDNMGKFLLAFSSSSEEWIKLTRINSFNDEDLPVGGWGSAVLGRVFPLNNADFPPMFYVAGYAARSYLSMDNKFYLYGQIKASSSFSNAAPRFTYQEFYGLSFYSFSPKFIIGARLRQQTIWNWGFFNRQLMLDNNTGVRGYRIDNLVGDNRLVTNFEFRWMPDIPLIIFNLGFNAFWDAGTVWRRGVGFNKTRWHQSIGLGLILYKIDGDINSGSFRLDFAYNFDNKKISGIIFSVNQYFSFYRGHSYEAPKLMGLDIDN